MLYCLPLLFARLPPLFDDSPGYYNYTPCLVTDGDTEHVWYCRNLAAYEVTDTIAYRRRGPTGFSSPEVALAPEPGAWDGVHVCDPAVCAGEFRDGARVYHWIMAYLGCDQRDSRHNQLGLALADAPEGPWRAW